jgi:hypothetical protein
MWLQSIKLFNGEYFAVFEPRTWTGLLRAFTSAVRAAIFSGPAYCQLAAGTVSDSVNHVAASFVDPRNSEAGAPSRFLQGQYKSYQNLDKNLKEQKAITVSALLKCMPTSSCLSQHQPRKPRPAWRSEPSFSQCRPANMSMSPEPDEPNPCDSKT